MTLLFCDSFDHYYDNYMESKWTANNGCLISGGRRNTNGLVIWHYEESVRKNLLDNYETLIAGVAYYTTDPKENVVILGFKDYVTEGYDGFYQCELKIDGSARLKVCRNGTLLGTSYESLSADTWYYIEFKVTFNNTTGFAEVRVDEDVWITLEDVDTQYSDHAYANILMIENDNGSDINDRFDDLYICDTAGSYNNDYLGDIRIDAAQTSDEGALTEWSTATEDENWEMVHDLFNETSYILSNVSGTMDTYKFNDIPSSRGNILALVIHLVAQSEGDASVIKSILRSNGVNYLGSVPAFSTGLNSWNCFSKIYEANPTPINPWTIGRINEHEFGVALAKSEWAHVTQVAIELITTTVGGYIQGPLIQQC